MKGPANLIVVGASTGGTRLLPEMLAALPPLPAALLVIQHMPPFITTSFLRTIQKASQSTVRLAEDGSDLQEGEIVLVPGGVHCSLQHNLTLRVGSGPKVNFVCPSIDVTLLSTQATRDGQRLFGVLLTGMGRDGAAGLAHIKRLGGMTIVQDKASCAVYGMPAEAVKLGCVDYQLPPPEIVRLLAAEMMNKPPMRIRDRMQTPARNIAQLPALAARNI